MADLAELIPPLAVETGNHLEPTYLMLLLQAGLLKFNAIAADTVDADGTTLSRTLTPSESRLIVMLAIASYIRGEWIKATQNAIVHLNVAGRTDLRTPAVEFKHLARLLSDELGPLLAEVTRGNAIGSSSILELGETLRYAGVPLPAWPLV